MCKSLYTRTPVPPLAEFSSPACRSSELPTELRIGICMGICGILDGSHVHHAILSGKESADSEVQCQ